MASGRRWEMTPVIQQMELEGDYPDDAIRTMGGS
jgi:hypothetical protein